MMCTQGLRDYDWNYSLKILAHFRSKVLEDFPHYVTQINCLTGAKISETYIRHILRINIFNDYTILHKTDKSLNTVIKVKNSLFCLFSLITCFAWVFWQHFHGLEKTSNYAICYTYIAFLKEHCFESYLHFYKLWSQTRTKQRNKREILSL